MEDDSYDNSEVEVGEALANLLTDPAADLGNLGDNFTVSMIGEELCVDATSGILDASKAPCLTWQLEEGFLSSSKSGDEPESDSTESVGSGSDLSQSGKSESGIRGGGNSDAKVLSRSLFNFSFESVTKDGPFE